MPLSVTSTLLKEVRSLLGRNTASISALMVQSHFVKAPSSLINLHAAMNMLELIHVPVFFTPEDACTKEELGAHQLQLEVLLRAASVRCVECPAEHGSCCVCNIGPTGRDHCWCLAEASPVRTWSA